MVLQGTGRRENGAHASRINITHVLIQHHRAASDGMVHRQVWCAKLVCKLSASLLPTMGVLGACAAARLGRPWRSLSSLGIQGIFACRLCIPKVRTLDSQSRDFGSAKSSLAATPESVQSAPTLRIHTSFDNQNRAAGRDFDPFA